jgi:hypothetical protein
MLHASDSSQPEKVVAISVFFNTKISSSDKNKLEIWMKKRINQDNLLINFEILD